VFQVIQMKFGGQQICHFNQVKLIQFS